MAFGHRRGWGAPKIPDMALPPERDAKARRNERTLHPSLDESVGGGLKAAARAGVTGGMPLAARTLEVRRLTRRSVGTDVRVVQVQSTVELRHRFQQDQADALRPERDCTS